MKTTLWISFTVLVCAALAFLFYSVAPSFLSKGAPHHEILFVASDTDLSEADTLSSRNRLDVFRDIVRSEWSAKVDIVTYEEFSADTTDYDALFVINTSDEPLPEHIKQAVQVFPKKVAIIGYSFFRNEDRNQVVKTDHLLYGDVTFEFKGEYIFPYLSLDIDEFVHGDEFVPTAYTVSADGSRLPFIHYDSDRRLLISLRLPNYYETDSHTTIFLAAIESLLGCGSFCREEDSPALLRLEDVNPFTYKDTAHLSEVFSYLDSKGAGINIALITRYLNPPLNVAIDLSESEDLTGLIKDYLEKGKLTLIQHGYTHQTGEEESAIGFEFWDIERNAPLENDSKEYVEDRVARAQAETEKSGLPIPTIWETPHYALSELDNEVINKLYSYRYERTNEFGALPFVITRHYENGERVTYVPENLNYIGGEEDIVRIEKELNQLSVIEGSVPSLFWHPWRNIGEIERIVDMFEKRGYRFVTAEKLLGK